MPTEPSHPYEILDVFTDTPLQGNPLAVFTEGEAVPSRLMQATARELNLSETVFVMPVDGEQDAQIRIFTPLAELPFAGHPVLGTAFVIGERNNLATVRLVTRAGEIPVRLTREHGEIVYGEMDQPIPTLAPFPHAGELLAALRIEAAELPVEQYDNGPIHVIVVLAEARQVAELEPSISALTALGPLTISCCARTGDRFKTRVFGPGLGVIEDPATGSAAGPLALHLARHGWTDFGQRITIEQGAEIRRPSLLHARVEGNPAVTDGIVVGGAAVLVGRGEFRLA